MEDYLLKYKIGLSLIPGIGDINARRLVAYTGGIEAVFKENKKNLIKIPGIGEVLAESILNQKILDKAEKEIEFLNRYEIKHKFYLEDDYPARLKNCEDSPIMFYYMGDVDYNQQKVISIVGTRNASDYGKDCCNKLIDELSNRNHQVLIVSGLAYGIDICAHRAAQRNAMETVAVLGHGLGTLYPAVHKATAAEICKHGALVSDFVSDTLPDRNTFVKRNRIIAGLADVTIVVESGIKGGALITADIACSYNRDVMAFPGRVDDMYSRGCNWLIRSNKAALIEGVEDLEYLLGWDVNTKNTEGKPTELFVELSDEDKKIADILREHGELTVDLLSLHANMPVSMVSAHLLTIELTGMIRSLPGKVYKFNR
jgi:DNA processing protein